MSDWEETWEESQKAVRESAQRELLMEHLREFNDDRFDPTHYEDKTLDQLKSELSYYAQQYRTLSQWFPEVLLENEALRAQFANEIDVPYPPVPAKFDTYADHLLNIIGRMGEFRKKALGPMLASDMGTESAHSSPIIDAFKELENRNLTFSVEVPVGGQPHLVGLTEEGVKVYKYRNGQEPRTPSLQWLLSAHRTPLHTYYILETADAINRFEKFSVHLDVKSVKTESGGLFAPDIIIASEEYPPPSIYWVEVETGRTSPRPEKWEMFARYSTDGVFYVVCANKKAFSKVRAEIEKADMQYEFSVNAELTTIQHLQECAVTRSSWWSAWKSWDYRDTQK